MCLCALFRFSFVFFYFRSIVYWFLFVVSFLSCRYLLILVSYFSDVFFVFLVLHPSAFPVGSFFFFFGFFISVVLYFSGHFQLIVVCRYYIAVFSLQSCPVTYLLPFFCPLLIFCYFFFFSPFYNFHLFHFYSHFQLVIGFLLAFSPFSSCSSSLFSFFVVVFHILLLFQLFFPFLFLDVSF